VWDLFAAAQRGCWSPADRAFLANTVALCAMQGQREVKGARLYLVLALGRRTKLN